MERRAKQIGHARKITAFKIKKRNDHKVVTLFCIYVLLNESALNKSAVLTTHIIQNDAGRHSYVQ